MTTVKSTYLQKLPTFKKWAGERPVIPLGVSHDFIPGEGVVVLALHGTTRDFSVFDRSFSNSESNLGSGFYFSNNPNDIRNNYSTMGPDLTSKIEHEIEMLVDCLLDDVDGDDEVAKERAKEIVYQKHLENNGFTMPVFVRFDNPVIIGGKKETYLDYEEIYNEEFDEYEEPTGMVVKLIEAFREICSENDRYGDFDPEIMVSDIFSNGDVDDGIKVSRFIEICNKSSGLCQTVDYEDNGKLCANEIIRQAFERVGFDGIIDLSVNEKFGSSRNWGKPMDGMDPSTIHFIAFQPNQIKSALGNSGAFDPNSKDICDSHVAHAVEVADYYGAPHVMSELVHEVEMVPC